MQLSFISCSPKHQDSFITSIAVLHRSTRSCVSLRAQATRDSYSVFWTIFARRMAGNDVMAIRLSCALPALQAAERLLLSKLEQPSQLVGKATPPKCLSDWGELETLDASLHNLTCLSDALVNKTLNRYNDVLPYNHTRVRLNHAAASECDYINASHLTLPSSLESHGMPARNYIAAQGPLDHTRESFWQTVLEQRCTAIVMLTNCVERSIRKCAQYFPTQPGTKKRFGRFIVKTLELEEIAPKLYLRRLLLCNEKEREQKLPIDHYHYTAWPDHGVPSSPLPLLKACAHLQRSGAHAGPILVHCSAGIGRSGVFCVLDAVTRRLRQLDFQDVQAGEQAVSVLPLVRAFRQQRMGMVQTREQYVFCHTALLHFVRQLDAEQHQVNKGGEGLSGQKRGSTEV